MIVKRHRAGFFFLSLFFFFISWQMQSVPVSGTHTVRPLTVRFVYKKKKEKKRRQEKNKCSTHSDTLIYVWWLITARERRPSSHDRQYVEALLLLLLLVFLSPDASSSPPFSSVVIVVICVVCWSTDFSRISYDSFQSITSGLHQGQRRERRKKGRSLMLQVLYTSSSHTIFLSFFFFFRANGRYAGKKSSLIGSFRIFQVVFLFIIIIIFGVHELLSISNLNWAQPNGI